MCMMKGEGSTHCPELYEVLEDRSCDEQTVDKRVSQEQDEELVVGETHTVIHPMDNRGKERCEQQIQFQCQQPVSHSPGTVMIHLQYTPASNKNKHLEERVKAIQENMEYQVAKMTQIKSEMELNQI